MTRRLLLLAAALFFTTRASAQSKNDFSTVRFYPAVGPGNYVMVDGAGVGSHLNTSYGVMLDYAANNLVVNDECSNIRNASPNCTNKQVAFLPSTGTLHLSASMSIKDRGQVAIDVPLAITDTHRFDTVATAGYAVNIKPKDGFGLADARLSGKVRVFGRPDDNIQYSVLAFTTLPTALITSNGDCKDFQQCRFLGERGVQAGALAISEFSVPEFRVAVNAGVAYRPKRNFLDAEVGTEVRYGVAGMYKITPLVHVGAEVTGAANLLGSKDYPVEARGMFSYGQDFLISVGAGAGITGDIDSPTYRIFLRTQYQPLTHDEDQDGIEDKNDSCPSDVEDKDGFMDEDGCPEPDNDDDGIPDAQDACDDEPEDFDKFADDDGCPDNDNDGDGVPDGYDSCESEKEDMDGDRDDDGCPDLDTDRDGVDDANDKCPNEAEDTDGLGDDDGCPETDFDGDGVNDTEDACPDATEWWNDILDTDGCPEDDSDNDTVPDAIDRCPDNAETLNGTADNDGCPDGAMTMVLKGNVLLPTDTPVFDKEVLRGGAQLVDAASDYVKRNHKRGNIRVVVIAPADQTESAARAAHLAALLQKRSGREVTSAHIVGTPMHVEIELLPPGWKELPRKTPKPPAPAAKPAAPTTPASTPAPTAPAPAAPAPAAPAPSVPAAPPH